MASYTARQIFAVFGVLLNVAACGFHLGHPTILFRDLKAEDSLIPLTLDMESWISSSIAITTLLSFLLVAPLMERHGRKIAHLAVILPNVATCIMLYFATDVTTIVLARLIYGISCGGTVALSAIIVAEFTSPKIRGTLLNAKTSAIVFGAGYAHFLGLFFDWRMVALLGLKLAVASFVITLTWPESPAWLARRGKYESCEKSFIWLRGQSASAKKELNDLIEVERNRRASKTTQRNAKPIWTKLKKFFMILTRRDFLRPMYIIICVFVILETCGRHVFPTYAIKIVNAFTGGQSSLHYVVGLDCVILFTSIVACVVVNLFKRRTLLFCTGSFCCVLLLAICLCLYLKSKEMISRDNAWVPFTLFILYFVFLNIGTSPIVLTLLGEVIPLKYRSMGVAVSGILFSITLTIALKVTPVMIDTIDVHGTFTVFSLFMIGALIYLYYNMPETKDKTLQEIEEYFVDVKGEVKLSYEIEVDEMSKTQLVFESERNEMCENK